METKEAIEFVKDEVILANNDLGVYIIIKRDNVIELLQQGEKYKQIIEELEQFYGNGILENECGLGVQLKNLIEILKQKYLKEVNK